MSVKCLDLRVTLKPLWLSGSFRKKQRKWIYLQLLFGLGGGRGRFVPV